MYIIMVLLEVRLTVWEEVWIIVLHIDGRIDDENNGNCNKYIDCEQLSDKNTK